MDQMAYQECPDLMAVKVQSGCQVRMACHECLVSMEAEEQEEELGHRYPLKVVEQLSPQCLALCL